MGHLRRHSVYSLVNGSRQGLFGCVERKKNNKKNMTFFLSGEKRSTMFSRRRKKGKRERKESILIKIHLFVIYLVNTLFTQDVFRQKRPNFQSASAMSLTLSTILSFEMCQSKKGKKPGELNFLVGGKNKKNPEKSIFFSCRA